MSNILTEAGVPSISPVISQGASMRPVQLITSQQGPDSRGRSTSIVTQTAVDESSPHPGGWYFIATEELRSGGADE
jgi:hypothetical protein